MIRRSLWGFTVSLALASCTAAGAGGRGPQPGAAADGDSKAELSELIVLRPAGPFRPGDTVRADLSSAPRGDRIAYRQSDGRSGRIPLAALGAAAGAMVVRADRVNVRRCRSRGCSVIGYVARGQVVQVHGYVAGWYRYRDDAGTRGYVRAEYLELPAAYAPVLVDEIRRRVAAYYDWALQRVTVSGYGRVFSGHSVGLKENGTLAIAFYTPFSDGPPLDSACSAMSGIARFVDGLMGELSGQLFSAYSVGIYRGSPGRSLAREKAMVAGLTAAGEPFCLSPG